MTTAVIDEKPQRFIKVRRTWSLIKAFVRMDFVEEISYPLSAVMDRLGTVAPVAIYFFVAKLVPVQERVGDDYYTFAMIGFAVSAVLTQALSGFGGALQAAQDRGTFETFLVEPVPWTVLPFLMNLWRTASGFFNGLLILGMAVLLGAHFQLSGVFPFLIVLSLGILASAAVGILAASLMVLAKRSQPVLRVYSLLGALVGGVFFPVAMLPDWMRFLAFLVPHTYVIEAARASLMVDPGAQTIASYGQAVTFLGLFAVVTLAIGLVLFNRALKYARKMGMLSGY